MSKKFNPLHLPVTAATEAEMAKFPAYIKIVDEKEAILNKGIIDARGLELASIFIAMGNGMLSYICAGGGDIAISFPAFNHAIDLLPSNSDPYSQVMFQGAIGLHACGRKEEALSRLKITLDAYSADLYQSNPGDLADSPLSYALAAFWPAKSGGILKITGLDLFDEYALLIKRSQGTKGEELFWEKIVKNLPLRTYFTALHVHARIRYASFLIDNKEYQKAIFLLNEALYCYEIGRFENYAKLVSQCENMLSHIFVEHKPLSSHLVSMVYNKPGAGDDTNNLLNAIKNPLCPNEEKIFSALLLAHSSEIVTARSKQPQDLNEAIKYLESALPILELTDLKKAIIGYYRLMLCLIELGKEAEAKTAFIKAIHLHRRSPVEGNNLMHQAEAGTVAFNPFSKSASPMQAIYRQWRDTIATVRGNNNVAPPTLFDEISQKISQQQFN